MEISFHTGHTLTTEHPASHYQLGVLLDWAGNVFSPSEPLVADPKTKQGEQ